MRNIAEIGEAGICLKVWYFLLLERPRGSIPLVHANAYGQSAFSPFTISH